MAGIEKTGEKRESLEKGREERERERENSRSNKSRETSSALSAKRASTLSPVAEAAL